jgi:dipeptidase E
MPALATLVVARSDPGYLAGMGVESHIVAMGGGGFSMEPDNPLLDDFVLGLVRRSPPRVCFVPTASADSAEYLVKFYRAFAARGCIPTDVTFFDPPALPRRPASVEALAPFILEQDVIYVGGGNTANLLAVWRAQGFDRVLREAWERGVVLCGVSAGMNCWFEASLSDSSGSLHALRDGLGLLAGSACPHYDSEAGRRPRFRELVAADLPDGYAADDGAAVHFAGERLVEAVSSRATARAYRVERAAAGVVETEISTRYLGITS